MDLKIVFLNDDLEDKIYMKQPGKFVMHGQENKVRKLGKSLHGLKQALKKWHAKFNNLM
jgi:hypothetical protein